MTTRNIVPEADKQADLVFDPSARDTGIPDDLDEIRSDGGIDCRERRVVKIGEHGLQLCFI